jgi:hypothetical protein
MSAIQDVEHSRRTQRNQRRYLFAAKHHGANPAAATWLSEIGNDTEFSIFDAADEGQFHDDRGWLYGILPDGEGGLRELGVWEEQVAEFQPGVNLEDPWHGYPKWALSDEGPKNRRKQQARPDIVVFDRMIEAGLITLLQRRRLLGGKHA